MPAIASPAPAVINPNSAAPRTWLSDFFSWFGQLGMFCASVARVALVPPFEGREFLRQLDAIGSKSLPLVSLAGGATGVVLAMQARDSLARFGAKSMLPSLIFYSLIKESGPIITGLVVSGRVGAGIGAELGSMRVTEQIDAMEASAVDPYKYLVATRVIACIVALPLLTLVADFCGIVMGWVATTLADPVSLRGFVINATSGATFDDFLPPTFKTTIYGLIIGVVACFQGMKTKGGTAGVGRATTNAVVISSLFIILSDVVLVRIIQVFFS
jgi:phospholipid/cholesterol/gamma-HCH transport system permease protein